MANIDGQAHTGNIGTNRAKLQMGGKTKRPSGKDILKALLPPKGKKGK